MVVVVDEMVVVEGMRVVVVVGGGSVGGGATDTSVEVVDETSGTELVVAELPEQETISTIEARNRQVLRTTPR
jgi:hypothetical protein